MTTTVTHIAFAIKQQAEAFKKMVTKKDDYDIVEFVPKEFIGLGANDPSRVAFCYAVMAKEATEDIRSDNRELKAKIEQLKKELNNEKTNVSILRADLAATEAALAEARKLRFD